MLPVPCPLLGWLAQLDGHSRADQGQAYNDAQPSRPGPLSLSAFTHQDILRHLRRLPPPAGSTHCAWRENCGCRAPGLCLGTPSCLTLRHDPQPSQSATAHVSPLGRHVAEGGQNPPRRTQTRASIYDEARRHERPALGVVAGGSRGWSVDGAPDVPTILSRQRLGNPRPLPSAAQVRPETVRLVWWSRSGFRATGLHRRAPLRLKSRDL
jgi:hypothetical protein